MQKRKDVNYPGLTLFSTSENIFCNSDTMYSKLDEKNVDFKTVCESVYLNFTSPFSFRTKGNSNEKGFATKENQS